MCQACAGSYWMPSWPLIAALHAATKLTILIQTAKGNVRACWQQRPASSYRPSTAYLPDLVLATCLTLRVAFWAMPSIHCSGCGPVRPCYLDQKAAGRPQNEQRKRQLWA